jgi:hypothetical protein
MIETYGVTEAIVCSVSCVKTVEVKMSWLLPKNV